MKEGMQNGMHAMSHAYTRFQSDFLFLSSAEGECEQKHMLSPGKKKKCLFHFQWDGDALHWFKDEVEQSSFKKLEKKQNNHTR